MAGENWRGRIEAYCGGLLNRLGGKTPSRVRISPPPQKRSLSSRSEIDALTCAKIISI